MAGQSRKTKTSSGEKKVGSDANAARNFGGENDFGSAESGSRRQRDYVSKEIKANDPGGMPAHSGGEGLRESGVGANESGPGSGSGGDVDTDLVGLDGSVVSQSGPDDRTDGADMIRGDEPATQRKSAAKVTREIVRGSTVDHSGGDISTTGAGQGAGAVTNPDASNDDSFRGEINLSEASGADDGPADRA